MVSWLTDFNALPEALSSQKGYVSQFSRTSSQILFRFFERIQYCSFSAVSGQGCEEFFDKLENCRKDYWKSYRPNIEKSIAMNRQKDISSKIRRFNSDYKTDIQQHLDVLDLQSSKNTHTKSPSSADSVTLRISKNPDPLSLLSPSHYNHNHPSSTISSPHSNPTTASKTTLNPSDSVISPPSQAKSFKSVRTSPSTVNPKFPHPLQQYSALKNNPDHRSIFAKSFTSSNTDSLQ